MEALAPLLHIPFDEIESRLTTADISSILQRHERLSSLWEKIVQLPGPFVLSLRRPARILVPESHGNTNDPRFIDHFMALQYAEQIAMHLVWNKETWPTAEFLYKKLPREMRSDKQYLDAMMGAMEMLSPLAWWRGVKPKQVHIIMVGLQHFWEGSIQFSAET